ncbi:hypothetical protein C5748_25730 [Phyllobacterium phragmitis]|uniref:Uncharacterized protein n=1 Tax=Phyllobacterium phragmitis TaxID=2670329 RepID=A0A2S9IJH8_9HYPH|nr:hypothetical protein [Phyllobacterium phragmitis]PRD40668.1 hypothetical protein C5748_25730 [Phyllobacterium phragmitis]
MTSNRIQETKGPAEAATSPDHGSNLRKGYQNMETHSTTSAAPATVDLEGAINDLSSMANIAANLIEHSFSSTHESVTGSKDMFHLTPEELNRIVWAAYQTDFMARDLVKAFNDEVLA